MSLKLRGVALAALLVLFDQASTAPSADLSAGTVYGGLCSTTETKHFQGIPYAKPPVGKLRFQPPQPYNESYEGGSYNATTPPHPCIQFPSSFSVDDPTPSEDCLYLDVYVPANATADSALPVKVWGYGGANKGGALTYPLYDGCNLAQDAILVSFNYRLGPLGFLALSSAGIKGNMAIQDYLEALRWVKSNIAAFGGNPSQIVLFGQSAGADDTFTVSTLPEAKSLISSAILESGGGQDILSKELAQYTGSSFATTLGCDDDDLQCMQSKSVDDLITAYSNTPALVDDTAHGDKLLTLYDLNLPNVTTLSSAVLDGEVIKENPLYVGPQVPVIAGSNEDDSNLFTLPILLPEVESITEDNYTAFLAAWGQLGPVIEKQYPLSLFNTSGSTQAAVVAAISHISTTVSYTCQTYRALKAAVAAGSPAYAYRFSHTPSCPWLWVQGEAIPPPEYAQFFGSSHTAELPLIFGNLDNQPWGNGSCNATAAEREISRDLISAWTAMAAKGDPSTAEQQWPKFTSCNTQGILINDSFSVGEIDFAECQFWDAIWPKLGGFNISSVDRSTCSGNATNSAEGNTTSGGQGSSPSPSIPVTPASIGGVLEPRSATLAGFVLFLIYALYF